MIAIDTGVLVAYLDRDDPLNERAEEALADAFGGPHGAPFSTDYVLDEGLTLLRVRVGRSAVSKQFASLFEPADDRVSFPMAMTGIEEISEAKRLHFRTFDRRLSFTDCTLIAHAKRRNAKILTFDRGFDGLVEVVHP